MPMPLFIYSTAGGRTTRVARSSAGATEWTVRCHDNEDHPDGFSRCTLSEESERRRRPAAYVSARRALNVQLPELTQFIFASPFRLLDVPKRRADHLPWEKWS